jgi:hypothetical protein
MLVKNPNKASSFMVSPFKVRAIALPELSVACTGRGLDCDESVAPPWL